MGDYNAEINSLKKQRMYLWIAVALSLIDQSIRWWRWMNG
jgi:hypothetical protein